METLTASIACTTTQALRRNGSATPVPIKSLIRSFVCCSNICQAASPAPQPCQQSPSQQGCAIRRNSPYSRTADAARPAPRLFLHYGVSVAVSSTALARRPRSPSAFLRGAYKQHGGSSDGSSGCPRAVGGAAV